MIITHKAVGLICMVLAFVGTCAMIYEICSGLSYLWVTFG